MNFDAADQAAVVQDVPPNEVVAEQDQLPTMRRNQNNRGNPLDDPSRMDLTPQERQWALELKEAIEQDPELEPISDFWCVQLAIKEEGNLECALDRARHMQGFRQEYEIEDTTESGLHVMTEFVKLVPGFHLALSYCADTGNYIGVYDFSKFYTTKIASEPGGIALWLSSFYHHSNALNPDFEACRRGSSVLAECDGFDWKVNIPSKDMIRLNGEIAAVYPQSHQHMKYFNTGVLFNLMMSMVKKVMPKDCRNLVEFGCRTEFGRLDMVYAVPSLETATQRFLLRHKDSLDRRYANEASFSL